MYRFCLSTIFRLDFETVPTVWYFFVGSIETKAQVTFSHHLASTSIIHYLFTFWSFSQEPLGHIGPNLDVKLLWWSSCKIVSDDLALHPGWPIWLLIGWKLAILWKSISSEPLNDMKPNFIQILLGSSPFKIVPVDPIIFQNGRHSWLCNLWFSSIILCFCYPI